MLFYISWYYISYIYDISCYIYIYIHIYIQVQFESIQIQTQLNPIHLDQFSSIQIQLDPIQLRSNPSVISLGLSCASSRSLLGVAGTASMGDRRAKVNFGWRTGSSQPLGTPLDELVPTPVPAEVPTTARGFRMALEEWGYQWRTNMRVVSNGRLAASKVKKKTKVQAATHQWVTNGAIIENPEKYFSDCHYVLMVLVPRVRWF